MKAELKAEINSTSKIISEKIDLHKNNATESKLRDIEYNPDMFKKIKRVTNTCNNPIPPLVGKDGRIMSNPNDKANLMASYFGSVHRP